MKPGEKRTRTPHSSPCLPTATLVWGCARQAKHHRAPRQATIGWGVGDWNLKLVGISGLEKLISVNDHLNLGWKSNPDL